MYDPLQNTYEKPKLKFLITTVYNFPLVGSGVVFDVKGYLSSLLTRSVKYQLATPHTGAGQCLHAVISSMPAASRAASVRRIVYIRFESQLSGLCLRCVCFVFSGMFVLKS